MRSRLRGVLAGLLLAAGGVAPAGAETLTEALVSAYRTNPTLAAARSALRVTDEDLAIALSGLRLQVSARGTYGRLSTEYSRQQKTFGEQTTANVTVVQPVLPLSVLAAVHSADARVEHGRAQLLETEQQVLLTVVQAYVNVLRDQQILSVTQEIVSSLARQLNSNQVRFSEGDLSRTDIALTRARLTQVQADQVAAEAALRRSLSAYQEVVGHPALDLAMPDLPPGLPTSAEEATGTALAGNPGLIMARRAEDIARADIAQADATLLPTLDVVGASDYSDTTNQFTQMERQNQVQLQLRIPLYEGGASQARVRKAKDVWSQRRAEFLAAERSVVRQVNDAFVTLSSTRNVIEYTRAGVDSAAEALEGVREEALHGFRTTLDVLQSEQNLLDAKRRLVSAQRDEIFAGWQLLATMGAFAGDKVGLPTAAYDPKAHADETRDAWFSTTPLSGDPVPVPTSTLTAPVPPMPPTVTPEDMATRAAAAPPAAPAAPAVMPASAPVPAPRPADMAPPQAIDAWWNVFGLDEGDIDSSETVPPR